MNSEELAKVAKLITPPDETRPPNTFTSEELSKELNYGIFRTRQAIRRAIDEGVIRTVSVQILTLSGKPTSTVMYQLVKK